MADIKNFNLVGASTKLQFGKGGAKLVQSENTFAFRTADELSLTNVDVATPTSDNHAATKAFVEGLLTSSSRIVDNAITTTAMVATDEVNGYVTVNARDPRKIKCFLLAIYYLFAAKLTALTALNCNICNVRPE